MQRRHLGQRPPLPGWLVSRDTPESSALEFHWLCWCSLNKLKFLWTTWKAWLMNQSDEKALGGRDIFSQKPWRQRRWIHTAVPESAVCSGEGAGKRMRFCVDCKFSMDPQWGVWGENWCHLQLFVHYPHQGQSWHCDPLLSSDHTRALCFRSQLHILRKTWANKNRLGQGLKKMKNLETMFYGE